MDSGKKARVIIPVTFDDHDSGIRSAGHRCTLHLCLFTLPHPSLSLTVVLLYMRSHPPQISKQAGPLRSFPTTLRQSAWPILPPIQPHTDFCLSLYRLLSLLHSTSASVCPIRASAQSTEPPTDSRPASSCFGRSHISLSPPLLSNRALILLPIEFISSSFPTP